MPTQSIDLEFILPVCNRESEVEQALEQVVACLREVAAPAAVAVVDQGSSDRTLERVDLVAAASPVPVRAIGCSRPGWHEAARRGIATTSARWVVFGYPDELEAGALDHAVRMLAGGRHVACAPAATVLDVTTADLIVGGLAPDGPMFVPDLPDSVRHAGLRLAAFGRVAGPALADLETATTAVMQQVAA
jgi:hypothetical protein